jgi:hypothetical protein
MGAEVSTSKEQSCWADERGGQCAISCPTCLCICCVPISLILICTWDCAPVEAHRWAVPVPRKKEGEE